ncbi:MAG: BMP family ABC transporter substrate-binding protein, partial [Acidimicrobiales bacterium]|nr:BMP family ABC transporter substrate-binding protein [Acidimicrobiales bacterium]
VAQTNGDGSEAHVQQLAAEWMADNAGLVTDWIAAASAPPAAPATTVAPAEPPAEPPAETKAAFIYVGPPGDAGWTWAHDQGRQYAEAETGVVTASVESVPEGTADFGNYARQFIEDGFNVIVGTSFGYMDDMLALADEYPDVVFEHVSGYKANETNFGNTFGRMYEPRYLSGMVAGSATSSNLIGYVAAFPIPEVIRGINAFALGVQETNPDAVVEVAWTSTWFDPVVEGDSAQALLDKGADVIAMHQDSTAAGEKAEAAGARWVSYNSDMSAFAPNAFLTAPVWNWGPRYVDIIEAAAAGTYTPGYYWGSMADGIVDLAPIAADVDADVVAAVEARKAEIIAGTFHPFSGPINDQAGNVMVAAGETMDDGSMLGMGLFVEGVVGATGMEPDDFWPELTASWRGITEDEIHVGVTMIDFPWLIEMGLSTEGWGDPQLIWEALLADLNASGGVRGRQIIVDGYEYYSPVPGMGISADGVCLELAADIETFAIVGGFLGPAEISNTCITATADTILLGGRQTSEFLAESTAPWLEFGTMKERRMDVFVSLLEQAGLLEGRTFALVGSTDGPYERAQAVLADHGVELVLDAFNDVTVGDVEAEDARWDVLVENVRSSGADTIFLVGGERAGVRNLSYAGIDIDKFVMNAETYTSLSANVTPDMAEGDITLDGMTDQEVWQTDETQACATAFSAANPDIEVLGPVDWVEGEKWYQGITNYCNWVAMLVLVMEAAGPNPTHESFLAGIESMTQFSLPSSPYASFGPGKYDASDTFRLSVFDQTIGADGGLVPMGPVLDGTP